MKKKFIIISITLVLIGSSFAAGLMMKAKESSAAASPLLSFGGMVILVDYCECSETFDIFYMPLLPSPPFLLSGWLGYVPELTLVYPFYNMLTPGVWHMGQYMPGLKTCYSFERFLCVGNDDLGTIFQVGTSAVPNPAA